MTEKHSALFPHTEIVDGLPTAIKDKLKQIICYRYGILPESNMLTTAIISHVLPGEFCCFTPGKLERVPPTTTAITVATQVTQPKLLEVCGSWTAQHTHAREEANILGEFGTFYTDLSALNFSIEIPTPETLAYYQAILLHTGDCVQFNSPIPLPVSIVNFEKNYADGYLKLPTHGGGYYLEVHDTPHLWSHVSPDGEGVVILGKKIGTDSYHLSAFKIPFGMAIYIPGHVIHCDGLLIGEIMAIYTATPNYSTVIIKDRAGNISEISLRDCKIIT